MKVKVSVYKADDGSFWCHTEKDVYGTGLNGSGSTVSEAKQDLYACLDIAKEDYLSQGKTPKPIEFEYVYDLQSFFEYFSVFNVTEVARRAGINPTLMRQYTSGVKRQERRRMPNSLPASTTSARILLPPAFDSLEGFHF